MCILIRNLARRQRGLEALQAVLIVGVSIFILLSLQQIWRRSLQPAIRDGVARIVDPQYTEGGNGGAATTIASGPDLSLPTTVVATAVRSGGQEPVGADRPVATGAANEQPVTSSQLNQSPAYTSTFPQVPGLTFEIGSGSFGAYAQLADRYPEFANALYNAGYSIESLQNGATMLSWVGNGYSMLSLSSDLRADYLNGDRRGVVIHSISAGLGITISNLLVAAGISAGIAGAPVTGLASLGAIPVFVGLGAATGNEIGNVLGNWIGNWISDHMGYAPSPTIRDIRPK